MAIPPDIAYCLDSAAESGIILGDVYGYLCYIDPAGTRAWHDDLEQRITGHDGSYFRMFPQEANERLDFWRTTAKPDLCAALTWSGIRSIAWHGEEAAKDLVSAAVENAVKSDVRTIDHAMASIADPEFALSARRDLFIQTENVIRRACSDLSTMGETDFLSREASFDEMRRLAYERDREVMMSLREEFGEQWQDRHQDRHQGQKRVTKSERKAKRKIVSKASSLLKTVVGPSEASAVLSRDDIYVEGKAFSFKVRLGVLNSTGHQGMNVTVTDKSHVELADLCIYFENTPALDQIAALVLHVQAGDEENIIKTANIIRTHYGADESPAFQKLKSAHFDRKATQRNLPTDEQFARIIDNSLYPEAKGTYGLIQQWHDELLPLAKTSVRNCVSQIASRLMLPDLSPRLTLSLTIERSLADMA